MKKNKQTNDKPPKTYRQVQGQCHLFCLCGGGTMSVKEDLPYSEEAKLLKNDLDGLNDVYKDIADEVGLENTLAIFKLFHGTQISFPNRLFSKAYTHQAIQNEYNGKNVPQLAQKYNYSERSIWRIIQAKNIRRNDNK